MNKAMIGFWAFIIGLILAVIAGIWFPAETWVILVLLALGLIMGFLNISDKQSMMFLIAIIALLAVGNVFRSITALDIGKYLGHILTLVGALVTPAAFIVAAKSLWTIGKSTE